MFNQPKVCPAPPNQPEDRPVQEQSPLPQPAEASAPGPAGATAPVVAPDPKSAPDPFARVLYDELKCVGDRRGEAAPPMPPDPPDPAAAREAAREKKLVGLAFSGGGIRSATVGLGLLQGLAESNLLGVFDYLSTVSGGGYIGSWFAAWVRREGELKNVEQQLKPNRAEQAEATRTIETTPWEKVLDEEPEPVYHLRAYSNYLSPMLGLFSADTWTLAAIYLRNLLITQILLLPSILAVLVAARYVVLFYDQSLPELRAPLGWGLLGLLLLALWLMAVELFKLESGTIGVAGQAPPSKMRVGPFQLLVIVPLLLAVVVGCWLFSPDPGGPAGRYLRLPEWLSFLQPSQEALDDLRDKGDFPWAGSLTYILVFAVLNGGVSLLGVVVVWLMVKVKLGSAPPTAAAQVPVSLGRQVLNGLRYSWAIASPFLAGGVGGFLVYVLLVKLLWFVPPYALAAFGPPLAMLVVVLASFCEAGLLGDLLNEAEREWWARAGAWMLIYAAGYLIVFGLSFYGGWLIQYVLTQLGPAWKTAVASGWLATTIGGVLAGRSPQTRNGRGNPVLEWLGVIAPPVFLVGLLASLSWAINLVVDGTVVGDPYWSHVLHPDLDRLGIMFAVCAGLALVGGFAVDANLFSLHAMYANRLIRCYLGASRPKAYWRKRIDGHAELSGTGGAPTNSQDGLRQENLITGFDLKDDFPLQDLTIGKPVPGKPNQVYWGPFPLINTALNLVGGEELAWQERKAEAFVLTPLYCGSKTTGYRRLPDTNTDLTLGRAVAISGAAASPNMGYHSSSALTALMTVFNARLGWWLQNPRRGNWEASSPACGPLLLTELFGRTNERKRYVYLSDGGHFENLGVYELVRRRCRYIVVCDGGADPDYEFQDLAGLVRKVRNDFGVRIEIDPSPLAPPGTDGHSTWHCTVGKIHYGDVDRPKTAVPADDDGYTGTLVYLKASLTGDETSDVLNYAEEHPQFPHQTTVDQFFNESQFESYRALGFHIARVVFCDALDHIPGARAAAKTIHLNSPARAAVADQLFHYLTERWYPAPPGYDSRFVEATLPYLKVLQVLREDSNLRQLSLALYPDLEQELQKLGAQAPQGRGIDQLCAERHVINHMLQVMENSWILLHLDNHYQHPINSGWREVFRLWTSPPAFKEHWRILSKEYSRSFVNFCVHELDLPAVP